MKTQEIALTTPSGSSLTAWLDQPAGGRPAACALLVHCFAPGTAAEQHLSLALTQQRFEVLRISCLSSAPLLSQELLQTAHAYLLAEQKAPALAIGHSLGGAALLTAAPDWPALQALALLSAPADDRALGSLLDEDEHDEEHAFVVYRQGAELSLDLDLLDQWHEDQVRQRLQGLKKALLILHSPQDREISVDSAAALFMASRHPKSFVSLDGADHFLSSAEDSRYAGSLIGAWAQRYVQLQPDALRTHMEVVTRTPAGGFTTEIRAGKHSLLADEPLALGGLDLGPNPYDLLNAALGACTSMTLRMYADRKGWPLQEAIVHLKHDRIYGEDCQVCEDNTSKLDQLSREVELIGPLDAAQRSRLMEIADRCPVHKTLQSKISIETRELDTD
ncbi:bifunctional alpha/beta hydrolase/OsmC family protein [Cesiribacter andamanensis]|uniref:OsmC-like protein n=1 Tax=Cesiribacter andamanensis AMV16 TaxID=1279009 RepID=M7P0W7_9BACT|nr:OsmC family protein [Cesiribacter andamanensis]EMR04229.1 OsmC-like protein [Cesiribacter andamanensis AMV16]